MITLLPFREHPHLAQIVRRRWQAVPMLTILSLLIGLLEGAGIGMLVPLLSTIAAAPDKGGRLTRLLNSFGADLSPSARLLAIAAAILTLVVLKNILAFVAGFRSATLHGRIAADVRDALSLRLERAPYSFHLRADAARLIQILATDSWQVADVARALISRVGSAATIAAFAALLLAIEWRLSLIVIVGALIARHVQTRVEKHLKRRSQAQVAENRRLTARMLFAIYGARVIRLFDQTAAEQARFEASSERLRRELLSLERLGAMLWPSLETLHATLFLLVLVLAFRMGVPLPELAAFLVLLNRVQPHLRTLEQSGGAYASQAGTLGEVEWLLDPAHVPVQSDEGRLPAMFDQHIRFNRVSFSYHARDQRAPVLEEVGFTIMKGSMTALLGSSGAGKSTVVNLLCGLLEPTSGSILIDGVPLGEIAREDWLRRVAVAGQDVDLFDGTVAENIAFGASSATETDIIEAARQAQAHFVFDLPEGIHTAVGERGLALSGGQRQRIGIARALLRLPDLLIFDEATSAVDRLAEREIVEILRALSQRVTVLIISHRAETLSHCRHGIVLNEGRVVEEGVPADLREMRLMVASSDT